MQIDTSTDIQKDRQDETIPNGRKKDRNKARRQTHKQIKTEQGQHK